MIRVENANVVLRIASLAFVLTILASVSVQASGIADSSEGKHVSLLTTYCVDCHSGDEAEARLDLESLLGSDIGSHYSDWLRVQQALEERAMPPADSEQPTAAEHSTLLSSLSGELTQAIEESRGDPGPSPPRRLTNAEYEYCLEDLTGVRFEFANQLVEESVGGTGFTNASTAQFLQSSSLERYLEAAKQVASHAMVGAGPIYFHSDPGATGLELSAVRRIQAIYRRYGFRAAAGEGAKPYGLEAFPQAFAAAWSYRYRSQLGNADETLEECALEFQVQPGLVQHVWRELNRVDAKFPMTDIIRHWNAFPTPEALTGDHRDAIREKSDKLFERVQAWQKRFANSASDEEEAAVLARGSINVPQSRRFLARALRKRLVRDGSFAVDENNRRLYSEDGTIRFEIRIEPASEHKGDAVVLFRNPVFGYRLEDLTRVAPVPLNNMVSDEVAAHLQFGVNPGGEPIGSGDFAVKVGATKVIELQLPEDSRLGEITLEAKLDSISGKDCVARCTITDITNRGAAGPNRRGREYSSLLRDPDSEFMDQWVDGLVQFSKALPQISHREPAPSDRDPIPAVFDSTYNKPERNYFHTAIKYYRDDQFLVDHLIPQSVARQLDRAWADLLTSFDYHDTLLRFVDKKYELDLQANAIAELEGRMLESVAPTTAALIRGYQYEYEQMWKLRTEAESGHLQDLARFAQNAWRRPLSVSELEGLNGFYQRCRTERDMGHAAAVRASIARVLVSPSFLFRGEQAPSSVDADRLAPEELASRMSFTLWSSIPDAELLTAARSGELASEDGMRRQVERMLASPKSRRFAVEFYGQWLGFYRFDTFRGVDESRFPEFDERLKDSVYEESIEFFHHLTRSDRPYNEFIHANYSFLDPRAARHFGVMYPDQDGSYEHLLTNTDGAGAGQEGLLSETEQLDGPIRQVEFSDAERGGVLGLGAILISTSAPLRTSPVKRGDWILRRLIGKPVPPPPADAGSIAAEEDAGDGLTMRERLEAHRQRSECQACHVRIDPLGFALEGFDSLGRAREEYVDGNPVEVSGELADGRPLEGFAGLKAYLFSRDDDVRDNFSQRLVAYALGRSSNIYDASVISDISKDLKQDPRISTAITRLFRSKQFSHVRGSQHGELAAKP